MDIKRIERFTKVFRNGIEPENLPVVLADVYQEVIKTRGLSVRAIHAQCEEIIYYIIDNTSAGRYDPEIDAIVKPMVPGMVTAFMNVRHGNFSYKKCC